MSLFKSLLLRLMVIRIPLEYHDLQEKGIWGHLLARSFWWWSWSNDSVDNVSIGESLGTFTSVFRTTSIIITLLSFTWRFKNHRLRSIKCWPDLASSTLLNDQYNKLVAKPRCKLVVMTFKSKRNTSGMFQCQSFHQHNCMEIL